MGAWAGAGLGAIGSLFGGLLGSGASSAAAQQYIQALQQAQTEIQGSTSNALAYQNPYTNLGTNTVGTLENLLGTPGQGLLQNWTGQFTAPTAAQAEQTPGYQFQLGQGESAMQNSAAGNGSLLTGRTLAGLNNYAQGTASSNYQNVFNNALTQYQSAYNSFLNNQNNTYNRLMGATGVGQRAADVSSGLTMQGGTDIASLIAQQGAVGAAGTIGSANAWTGALGGITNALSGGLQLNALNGNMANPIPPYNPGAYTGYSGATG